MRGMTITLYDRVATGKDALNKPTYSETPVTIDNVLIAPSSVVEVLDPNNLNGRRGDYVMAIPKGDTHEWTSGKRVNFLGKDWRIIDMPEEGIEWLIPLSWNKKVRVERYEQGDRFQAGSSGSEQTDEESGNAVDSAREG